MSEYNVFVSWSGTRSKAMGEAFRDWLPHVIQSAVPFFSDKDIASGSLWDDSLRSSLQSVNFAVVCCTIENVTAPWLNYEAGALVERLKGSTAPWLLDGRPEELQPSPLSRLQAKAADPIGTLAVLQALNMSLAAPLAPGILDSAFETHWPKLDAKLKAIPAGETKPKGREPGDMLQELVGLTRQISSDMARFSPYSTHGMFEEALAPGYGSGSQGPQDAGSVGQPFRPGGFGWSAVRQRAIELLRAAALAQLQRDLTEDESGVILAKVRRHSGGAQRVGALEKMIAAEVAGLGKADPDDVFLSTDFNKDDIETAEFRRMIGRFISTASYRDKIQVDVESCTEAAMDSIRSRVASNKVIRGSDAKSIAEMRV